MRYGARHADLGWYWELADVSCNHRMYEVDQDQLWNKRNHYSMWRSVWKKCQRCLNGKKNITCNPFVVDNNWPTQLWCRHHCDLLAGLDLERTYTLQLWVRGFWFKVVMLAYPELASFLGHTSIIQLHTEQFLKKYLQAGWMTSFCCCLVTQWCLDFYALHGL